MPNTLSKTRYYATLPDGTEVTRTSARTYTHVVIGVLGRSEREIKHEAHVKYHEGLQYKQTAPGYADEIHADFLKFGESKAAETVAMIPKWIEGTQQCIDRHMAEWAAETDALEYVMIGWAGRPDLADKLARNKKDTDYYQFEDFLVLEVQTR